jgi:hypothetical protein
MSNGNGHHWSKFVWRDWQNDPRLRLCSLPAQAVWMRLLCMMFDANGKLLLNGGSGNRQPTVREIAKIIWISERQIKRCIDELLQRGVARRNNDGVIYCQRMVNDFKASEVGKEAAAKRWNGHDPNGSPNGTPIDEPIGEATREPISQAYRAPTPDPTTKSQNQSKSQKEPPRSPPVSRGGRAAPQSRRGFADLERRLSAAAAGIEPTIEGTPDDVVHFADFHRKLTHG